MIDTEPLILGVEDKKEPYYKLHGWKHIRCLPFLDTRNTETLPRTFYFGQKQWLNYCLYALA